MRAQQADSCEFQDSTKLRSNGLLDVVHSDVCGPMQTPTLSGKRYFVTLIDDKSRYCVVYLTRSKSEMYDKFVQFVKLAGTQSGRRVKVASVRQRRRGVQVSQVLRVWCRPEPSSSSLLVHAQLNGVAERMDRTLVERARCMLEHAGLSKTYWGEAVMTAVFLRDRCPTRAIDSDKSPHEVWNGKEPLLANLKIFGCHAYVHVPSAKGSSSMRGRYDVDSSDTPSTRKRINLKNCKWSRFRQSRREVHGRRLRQWSSCCIVVVADGNKKRE